MCKVASSSFVVMLFTRKLRSVTVRQDQPFFFHELLSCVLVCLCGAFLLCVVVSFLFLARQHLRINNAVNDAFHDRCVHGGAGDASIVSTE